MARNGFKTVSLVYLQRWPKSAFAKCTAARPHKPVTMSEINVKYISYILQSVSIGMDAKETSL